MPPVDSADAAAAARAAAAAAAERARQEAIRRAAEAARKAAEQAAKQAQEAAKARLLHDRPVFERPKPAPVRLKPPESSHLTASETAAYVIAAKAITRKDPAADPHALIAKNPQLVSWIQSSSEQLEPARGRSAAMTMERLDSELDTKLTVANGQATLAGAPTGSSTDGSLDGVTDARSAMQALHVLSPNADVPEAGGLDTVQGCAKYLLASKNVTFWDGLSTGSDRDALEKIAAGQASPVEGSNATVDSAQPDLKMMQALVAMSQKTPIQINALTGGNHSDGSNHYSGHAVDLELGVGDPAQIESIAGQYGGERNSESDHIHIDFLEGGSGPIPAGGVTTSPSSNGPKLVNPLDTAMPTSSGFNLADGPEGMPGVNGGFVHGGLDWFAEGGTPLKAPVDGTIREVTPSKGNSGQVFGGVVKIEDSEGKLFVFRHVDPANLQVGQKVQAGQQLATVTDWADGSSHSHMEIWKNEAGGYRQSNAIDPFEFYKNGKAAPTTGATSGAMLDDQSLKKIMTEVDPATAKEAAPVVQQALAAAGITDPKESATFVAMVAERTHEFKDPDAYRTVVDTATQWKGNEEISKLAKAGELNQVASKLGIQVSPEQLEGGGDAVLAQKIDDLFASKNPEAASHKVANANGDMVTFGQLCVEEGRHRQMDPWIFMAIAQQETQYGTLGVGVEKMLGVSAIDSNPDGDFGMNGLSAQILHGGETFERLRAQNGSGPDDPMIKQLAAVNGYKNGDPNAERGQVWASDPTWWDHVNSNYEELTKNGDGLGPPQVGEQYYQRALSLFEPEPPPSTASSSSGASSGYSGSSSSTSTGSSPSTVTTSTPPPEQVERPFNYASNPDFAPLKTQTRDLGFNIEDGMLWFILGMINDGGDALIDALSGDPEFKAFCKSKGLKPGKKPSKAMIAGFLAKKMKGAGVKSVTDAKGAPRLVGKDGKTLTGADLDKLLGLGRSRTDPNAPVTTADPNAPVITADPNAPVTTADPNAPVTTADPNAPVITADPNLPGGPSTGPVITADPNAPVNTSDPTLVAEAATEDPAFASVATEPLTTMPRIIRG